MRYLNVFFMVLCCGLTSFLFGQQDSIVVKVFDTEMNKPISGANLTFIENGNYTQKISVTDKNGKAIVPQRSTFEISFEFFEPQRITSIQKDTLVMLSAKYIWINVEPVFIEEKAILRSIFQSKTIDQRTIELNQTQSPIHILNNQPGVVMQSGALNTNRISLRGVGNRSLFTTSKLKSYFDNIPLTNGVGETSIEDIDLSLLQSMEIGKGPGNTAYGASLGGVIKMNSKNIKNYQETSVDFSTTIGSYGLKRYVANGTYVNDARNLSVQLNYNNTSDDGHRGNNLYDRSGWAVLSKYEFAQNQLSLLYNYVDLNAQIPSSLNQDDYDNAPEKAAFIWQNVNGYEAGDKHLIGLNYKHQLSNNLSWDNSFAMNLRNSFEVRPFNVLEEDSRGYSIRSVVGQNNISGILSGLQMGLEFYNEDYNWDTFETLDAGAQGEQISENEEFRRYINLFVEAQKRFGNKDQWNLTAGLNINNTTYEYNDLFTSNGDNSGDYGFDWVLSPRLALNYQTHKNDQIGFEIAHGFAAPTLEETLTPDGEINPDIQPEKGWNFELSVNGNRNKLNYDASIYAMYINDLLVARRTDFDQFIGINAGQTRHLGLELSLDYNLIEQSDIRLNIEGNYTYSAYKFVDFIDGEDDYSGNELTGTAPHVWSSIFNFSFKNFGINFQHRFMDAVPLRDDNSFYSESFNLLHSKASYLLHFNDHFSLNIAAGVNNILNQKYASQYLINAGSFGGRAPRYYYPGRARNAYGQVKVKYLW